MSPKVQIYVLNLVKNSQRWSRWKNWEMSLKNLRKSQLRKMVRRRSNKRSSQRRSLRRNRRRKRTPTGSRLSATGCLPKSQRRQRSDVFCNDAGRDICIIWIEWIGWKGWVKCIKSSAPVHLQWIFPPAGKLLHHRPSPLAYILAVIYLVNDIHI